MFLNYFNIKIILFFKKLLKTIPTITSYIHHYSSEKNISRKWRLAGDF